MAARKHKEDSSRNFWMELSSLAESFYPHEVTQANELHFASRQVNTIEINGSFYSLKKPDDYRKWKSSVPDDFVFTVKGPRFITHIKRLNDVKFPLANFFASGVLELGKNLGPFLWQFSENFQFNAEKFETFLNLLPKNFKAASDLAKKHDDHIKVKAAYGKLSSKSIRHAFEVRHSSFADKKFIALMKKHNCAVVISDGAGQWPTFEIPTADFSYIRLHGGSKLYTSGYDDPELRKWATKIVELKRRGDVLCYFDNDVKARAPYDAMEMLKRVTRFVPEYSFEVKNRKQIKGPSKMKSRKK